MLLLFHNGTGTLESPLSLSSKQTVGLMSFKLANSKSKLKFNYYDYYWLRATKRYRIQALENHKCRAILVNPCSWNSHCRPSGPTQTLNWHLCMTRINNLQPLCLINIIHPLMSILRSRYQKGSNAMDIIINMLI